MRIYSKFRDYYDTVQSFGADPNVVYIRNTKQEVNDTIYKKYDKDRRWHYVRNLSGGWYIKHRFSIIFCGARYNGLVVSNWPDGVPQTAYSVDSLPCKASDRYDAEVLTQHFNQSFVDDNDHFVLDCPVFLIDKSGVTKNPKLGDFEFYKIKSPFEAYQELDMYISGVLGGKSPKLEEISDESMKLKKGFDHKYSFKKEPTKKTR